MGMTCTLGRVVDGRWERCKASAHGHKTGQPIVTWCETHLFSAGFGAPAINYRSQGFLDLMDDARDIMVVETARVRNETLQEWIKWPGSELDEQVYARMVARVIEINDERAAAIRSNQHAVGCNATVNRVQKQITSLRVSKPRGWRRDVKALERALGAIIERLDEELGS